MDHSSERSAFEELLNWLMMFSDTTRKIKKKNKFVLYKKIFTFSVKRKRTLITFDHHEIAVKKKTNRKEIKPAALFFVRTVSIRLHQIIEAD
jgi:hypothetical protein